MVSSHQEKDPEYFAENSGIPWNLPTVFRPDVIATIQQRGAFLLILRTALSAIPFVSDLCGVDVQ